MQFFDFTGISPDAFKEQVKSGKSDGEMLAWVLENASHKRVQSEIAVWSHYQDNRAPADVESRQYYNDYHAKLAPHREDLTSWFDVLDVDDYVSYGGKA
jgi:hypothetical protein